MYNKKLLSKIDLGKYSKSDPYKKDIIYDPMGQLKYPGQPTRIPSNNISMKGVNLPVLAVTDNGQKKMMQPGQEYNFPGANYVDEFPQAKKGGSLKSKKYTRSLDGTGSLFVESALFQKPKSNKKRIFHPKAKYYAEGGGLNKFQEGGPTDCGEGMVWDDETQQCVKNTIQPVDQVRMTQYTPYQVAYDQMHPREREIIQKKAEYLNKHKGLNRRAGVNQDNFPEKVLRNH